ncbi:alpha/beta hydrolase [Ideonella paludis]|uniref:alpha/beta hydrolase n=1 Tax=Ideonella paludis TaxID=1233411 RepID=UPI0036339E4F
MSSPAFNATDPAPRCLVLLLHGLTMLPQTMQAFAKVLEPQALVCCPAGPVQYPDGSLSWWPVDLAKREAALATGPVDLAQRSPKERARAREALHEAVRAARAQHPGLPLVLAGFSQGGMLAVDYLLQHPDAQADALALMSASRIDLDTWQPLLPRLAGLPVWVTHGRLDNDLAFSAGEGLRDMLHTAGAHVQWQPFDGGMS